MFEPVIEANLGLSADEIETALITNNDDLARIHIALLKVFIARIIFVPSLRGSQSACKHFADLIWSGQQCD